MKTIITLGIVWALCIPCTFAGGSISWEDVKARISKTDPELVTVIEKTFAVERTGGAVRLGPQFALPNNQHSIINHQFLPLTYSLNASSHIRGASPNRSARRSLDMAVYLGRATLKDRFCSAGCLST